MKKFFKSLAGLIIVLFLFLLFIIDRISCFTLFWIEYPSLKNWLYKDGNHENGFDFIFIQLSLIRVSSILSGFGVYYLIKYLLYGFA